MLKINLTCATLLLLTSLQLIDGRYSHGAYDLCLSCQNVREPRACVNFVEVWSMEVCTTERIMMLNGTRVWNFGFEEARLCTTDEFIRTSRSLSETRIPVNQPSGFVLCHECCDTDLCNHKLCGSHTYNDLLCLEGDHDAHVTYCNQNESCYASRQENARPKDLQYGCLSEDVCHELPRGDYHGSCQRCCSNDGCNGHICIATDSSTSEAPDSSPLTSTIGPTSEAETTESTTDSASSTTTPSTSTHIVHFTDCWDVQSQGGPAESGVYVIHPIQGSNASLSVRCDMVTGGGGWTVLQRRFDGSVNFDRSMSEYVEGFGDASGEYWAGLEWMHVLTTQGHIQMRVDLCTFAGQTGYAVYEGFVVLGQSDTYRLLLGRYTNGSIPDSLTYSDRNLSHNGSVFQTTGICFSQWRGGWWYHSCFGANLNGGRYNGGLVKGKENPGLKRHWVDILYNN